MTLNQAGTFVRNTLRYSQLCGIDFQVPTRTGQLRVNQDMFHEVATAVHEERIRCETYHHAHLPERNYAQYISRDVDTPDHSRTLQHDTMYLPSRDVDSPRGRALIAHEGLHAWCDLHNVDMYNRAEEAAGYIVQVIFLLKLDRHDNLNFGNPVVNDVLAAAKQIVHDHGLMESRSSPVSLSFEYDQGGNHGGDLAPLIVSLARIPEYPPGWTDLIHDGIGRTRPPPRRQHSCAWYAPFCT